MPSLTRSKSYKNLYPYFARRFFISWLVLISGLGCTLLASLLVFFPFYYKGLYLQ